MKHALHTFVLASTLVAACYGAGPIPPTADVEIVFARQAPTGNCDAAPYIGNVAFDAEGVGYAITLPYVSLLSCPTIGGISPADIEAWRFNDGIATASGTSLGVVTRSDGSLSRPRIAAPPPGRTQPFWIYQSQAHPFELDVNVGGGAMIATTMAGYFDAAGIVVDPTTIYAAGWTDTCPACNGVDDPNFPSGNSANPTGEVGYSLSAMPIDGGAASALFDPPLRLACSLTKDCLVGNTDSLLYLAFSTGPAYVGMTSKAAPMDVTIENLNLTTTTTPVGLAADDAHVAWSISAYYFQLQGDSPGECTIFQHDLPLATSGPTTMLLSTDKYSCHDLAIDGSSVYFAIVSVRRRSQDTFQKFMHGEGVGRITLTGGALTVETLRLDISGLGSGPRRIFVRGDSLYLVDPLAVVRIPKSALDGRHDFP